jgi:NitT/TauT family transport system substrate-binding protein
VLNLRVATAIGILLLNSATSIAQPLNEFRVAKANTSNTLGEDVWTYAVPKQLGYFAEERLNVSLLPAQGLAAGQILVNNGAEVATQLAESVLKLREQGANVSAIFTIKMNLGYSLAVPPDSKLTKLSDLVGKSVGFGQVGSGSELVLREQMRRDGIDGTYSAISLGYGAQVATALKSRQVDGIYYWDALYGLMANQGVAFRLLDVPLQDNLAGFQLVTRSDLLKSRSKDLVGYCRAIAKALLFTRTNPAAAVELFYKEFPATIPAGKTQDVIVAEGTQVLEKWLSNALKAIPAGDEPGKEYAERWEETRALFTASGVLQKGGSIAGAYTNDLHSRCYEFDKASIIQAAQNAKR